MNYRKLGRTGVSVSEIGFGAWALGGQWGSQSDDESGAALHRAIELGVNFIDTAQVYGDGRSERVIGEALREHGDRIIVATKTAPADGPWPPSPYCKAEDRYSEKHLRANVEERLRNLQTDCIDILQLHTWTRAWNRDPQPLEVLRKLRDEGKIRHIGISTPEQDQNSLVQLMREGFLDVVQVIYNIFEQEPAAEFLPVAQETGTAVIVRVAFDEGSLTGKYEKGHQFPADDFRSGYFEGDRLDRTVARVDAIKADVASVELPEPFTMAEVALKFVLDHPAVSTVIPGIRNIRQAELNIPVSDKPNLPAELMNKLRQRYWHRGVWYSGK